MIKNLIFDFGKVLVDYDFGAVIHEFFPEGDEAREKEFISIATRQEFLDACDREAIPFAEIIEDIKRSFPAYAREFQMFYDRYQDYVIGEMPQMRQTLTDLKARGFKLYGLTNWCSPVYQVMERFHEIFDLLDDRIISSEEKLIKPEAAIYERLLGKFGLEASECVFADDKEINIRGAEAVGIRGIVFRDYAQYLRELNVICEECGGL